MSPIEAILRKRIEQRAKSGLLRSLQNNDTGKLTDFASNDYLGLASSMALAEMIKHEVRNNPCKNGSAGSRLLTGNDMYTEETERQLASTFHAEGALIFNSGYAANLAVLSSLPQKGDTIVYDELAHASIKDGARLSLAKRFPFRHNDCDELESKIRKGQGHIYIVIESIYSMDGDQAPLRDIVALAMHYGCTIVLDEAHSTGVTGPAGSGMAVDMDLAASIPIRIYTFGKAMGIHGACVTGSDALRDYLINFARPFIYTTAPDRHTVASMRCAFRFLRENPVLQQELRKNTDLFTSETSEIKNRTQSSSAIQTLIIPGADAVKAAANEIRANGMDVRPIVSPTVPEGKERLRICLHSFNSPAEIMNLVNFIKRYAAHA